MSKTSSTVKLTEALGGARQSTRDIDRDVRTLGVSKAFEENEPSIAIPIASIADSPFQRRAPLDAEALESLMSSINDYGVITPVVVRELDDGGFELITGHRRTEACRRLGRETIPAVVRVMTDRDAARALAADNALHAGLSDWERYKHIAMLLDGKHSTLKDVGDVFGISKASVINLRAFGALPDDVHIVLDAYPKLIGGTVAYQLRDVAVSHPRIVFEAVILIRDRKINQSNALQWIEKRISPNVVKTAPHKYERSFGDRGEIRMTAIGTDVKLSGDIDVEKLMQLIDANLATVVLTAKGQDPDL